MLSPNWTVWNGNGKRLLCGCGFLKWSSEGGAGVALGGVAVLLELRERVVVGLDGLVSGL
jgi:hypothetical protein